MRLTSPTRERNPLSMAPMIDAVFLLLIFFLVVTMMKKENKDIDIELPQSVSAIKQLADDKALVIGITADGDIFLEGEPAGVNQLHEQLRSVATSQPQRQVRIDADENAPFHRVVQVMDICQFRNLRDVVIRTCDAR